MRTSGRRSSELSSSRLSWFGSVYLKTLRDYRIGILGWGLGMGLLMYSVLATFPSLVETAAARASLVSLAGSFAWIAEPVAVGTAGGFATFKVGFLILIIALWSLLAGSRMLRGEEERGSIDVLLSVPESRVQIALQKLAALWTATVGMCLLVALVTYAGGISVNADFGLGGALLFGLNLALISGFFGSLALLLAQFTQERATAAGITGGLLLIFIVLDMVHRVLSGPGAEWISRLSPVYYYNLSKPLIPSYGTNGGALLILLGLSLLVSAAAIALFAVRDVGGTVPLPAGLRPAERAVPLSQALPENAWSLRSVYSRSLARLLVPTFWWTVGIAGFAVWMVIVVQNIEQKLATIYESSPFLKTLLAKVGGSNVFTNASILSSLFIFLPLLLMAFAVTGSSSWAADEEEGRLELVLATPQPRLQVVLGRFAALTTATIAIGVVTLLAGGNVAAATLGMIPLGLLVAAIGYLLAGWVHAAIDTGILSFLLVIWFFITFIGPDLNLPDATLRLSAFYYYGTPLLHGWYVGDMLGILGVAIVALALASLRFAGKDIGI
jgi:ABC-2 type transport system permease protein